LVVMSTLTSTEVDKVPMFKPRTTTLDPSVESLAEGHEPVRVKGMVV